MNLAVYDQHIDSDTGELVSDPPSLVVGIVSGKMIAAGSLPSPLDRYIEVDDINGLSGDDAIRMFYVLAAHKYQGYSKVVYEGVEHSQVKEYINANFSNAEKYAIVAGIDADKILGDILD